MKQIVSKQIDNGKITIIDENNPKFVELVTEKHVSGVPTFIVDGNECDFTGTNTDPKLTCDGKEIEL